MSSSMRQCGVAPAPPLQNRTKGGFHPVSTSVVSRHDEHNGNADSSQSILETSCTLHTSRNFARIECIKRTATIPEVSRLRDLGRDPFKLLHHNADTHASAQGSPMVAFRPRGDQSRHLARRGHARTPLKGREWSHPSRPEVAIWDPYEPAATGRPLTSAGTRQQPPGPDRSREC